MARLIDPFCQAIGLSEIVDEGKRGEPFRPTFREDRDSRKARKSCPYDREVEKSLRAGSDINAMIFQWVPISWLTVARKKLRPIHSTRNRRQHETSKTLRKLAVIARHNKLENAVLSIGAARRNHATPSCHIIECACSGPEVAAGVQN